jgi:hypothetical protein
LLKHHEAELRRKGQEVQLTATDVEKALTAEEIAEARRSLPAEDVNGGSVGEPGTEDLRYIERCFRFVLGLPSNESIPIEPEDASRLSDIRNALDIARSSRNERIVELGEDRTAFFTELKAHVSGHLAPLIKTIDVGWDAPLLREGLSLVDLPGVGVANDDYQKVTTEEIRKARAVIVVVDRSGFTQAAADLLRSTGFLTSLLHDSSDPEADVPLLLVAIVKLDLTATDERSAAISRGEQPKPWLAYLDAACNEAVALVRDQIRDELRQIAANAPDTVRDALGGMVDRIIAEMAVHPVSALEYRKLCMADEEERARIKSPAESRIPQMAADLAAVASRTIQQQVSRFRQQASGLRNRLSTVLELLRSQWESDRGVGREIERLREELDLQIQPLRDEYRDRRAAFRVFLRETIPQKIEAGVYKATDQARQELDRYVRSLHDYHWATLRAAVRRGGAFIGARHVDLPNELTCRTNSPFGSKSQLLSYGRPRS